MKLTTDRGELTLPTDFSFEMEKNSVFFSEEGSASVAATVPATPADLAKLEFPTRIARKSRFVNMFPAVLQNGIYRKQGTLVVASADHSSINCSMAIDESDFYAQHKDKNLKDVFAQKVLTDYSTPAEWSGHFIGMYLTGNASTKFKVVPVAVNYDESSGEYQVNNEPIPEVLTDRLWHLQHSPRMITEGDKRIMVPEGYGIAPFLTLDYFFRTLFGLLGYVVDKDCFATNAILQNLILLHNCADVVCNGRVDFSDLVPNVKVSEILEWMQNKFHAQISVQPGTKKVDILLLDEILAAPYDCELSGSVTGYPTFTFSKSKRLVLTPDTSLEGAEAAVPTVPELVKKYGGWSELDEAHFPTAHPSSLVLRTATGDFYKYRDGQMERVGSNIFKFDRANADEAEEYSPEDLVPPMVFVGGILMPYIGERVHRNTTYNDSKKDNEQKIIIADYAGLSTRNLTYQYATTQKFNDSGLIRNGRINLNSEDIYFNFFKRYAGILLNNSIQVSGKFDLKIDELLNYDLYALKHFNGQMLLPTYIKYEVGRSIRCLEARFYVVKQWLDEVQDEPIIPPPSRLEWVFVNSEFEAIEAALPAGSTWNWAERDKFQTMRPDFDLTIPEYDGQESAHITRYIDIWRGTIYVEEKSFEQWCVVVAGN